MPCTTMSFGEAQIEAGKPAVAEKGRHAAALADEALGELVELGRRHARHAGRGQHLETLGQHPPGGGDAGDLGG